MSCGHGDVQGTSPIHVLVTTDACGPPLHPALGERPLLAGLLISFDIPAKKVELSNSCYPITGVSFAAFLKLQSFNEAASIAFCQVWQAVERARHASDSV